MDYKQTNTNIVNQTNKLHELNCTLSFCFRISLTTEECTSIYNWRYLQIVNLFWVYNSDCHEKPFSNSGNVKSYTVQNGEKAILLHMIYSLMYICQFSIEFNWTITLIILLCLSPGQSTSILWRKDTNQSLVFSNYVPQA